MTAVNASVTVLPAPATPPVNAAQIPSTNFCQFVIHAVAAVSIAPKLTVPVPPNSLKKPLIRSVTVFTTSANPSTTGLNTVVNQSEMACTASATVFPAPVNPKIDPKPSKNS